MNKDFYNSDFLKAGGAYSKGHYAQRNKQFAEYLKNISVKTVFEAACAEGNLAWYILSNNKEIVRYTASDYAEEGLKLAYTNLKEFIDSGRAELVNIDAEKWRQIAEYKPEMFICTCLEHLQNDLKIIAALPKGAWIVMSLPNFMCQGHLRSFKTMKNVYERYGHEMHFVRVWEQELRYSKLNIFFKIRKLLYKYRYKRPLAMFADLFGFEIYGAKKKFNIIGVKK